MLSLVLIVDDRALINGSIPPLIVSRTLGRVSGVRLFLGCCVGYRDVPWCVGFYPIGA